MKIITVGRVFLLLGLGLVGIGIYYVGFKKVEKVYNYEKIELTNITQKTSVTGKVKPINNVDLTFEQSGKISEVFVKVGDHVKANSILVKMTSQELLAQLQEANANHEQEKIRLQELENGTREEEVTVQKTRYQGNEVAVKNAIKVLETQINEIFIESKFIVKNTIAGLAENPSNPNSKIVLHANDYIRLNNLQNDRFYLSKMIDEWETFLKDNFDAKKSFILAEKNLKQLQKYTEDLIYLTPNFWAHTKEAQAKLDQWKAVMTATQAQINSLLLSLNTAYNAIATAEKAQNVVLEELNLTKAGTRPEQIAMQQTRIQAAQARINQIQALINKTVLTAPFDGTITKVGAQKGEIISLSSTKEILVSMISEGYEIELYVPEIDIAKIEIGDPVVIRFDAFDDYEVMSQIKFVEPAETEVQGVVFYQVKIKLDPKEVPLEIRSGMSVDVDIITEEKENVIKIPQRRVITENGEKIVRILVPKTEGFDETAVAVKTGIRDDDGNIEILNGLKAGDLLMLD